MRSPSPASGSDPSLTAPQPFAVVAEVGSQRGDYPFSTNVNVPSLPDDVSFTTMRHSER